MVQPWPKSFFLPERVEEEEEKTLYPAGIAGIARISQIARMGLEADGARGEADGGGGVGC
jgi:hypothetical protein